jgi:hypothetical protein
MYVMGRDVGQNRHRLCRILVIFIEDWLISALEIYCPRLMILIILKNSCALNKILLLCCNAGVPQKKNSIASVPRAANG